VILVPPGVRILLAAQPVDFRKGMDGLAALVQQALRADPFAGDVFIFRPRRADRVKILVYDGTGLVEPCSQNLCKGGRLRGYRQCRRAAGTGALDGGVPWKRETPPRRSRLGPSCPRPDAGGWPS
jgi:transposase